MLLRFGGFTLLSLCVPALCLAQGTFTISTIAGGNPLITGIGDNGLAVNCFLNGPGGVTLDAAGNIYIADTGDQLVRKVSASTGIITTVAGTNGQPGFSGDGGPAKSAKLHAPSGLAVDKAGNLYISDTLNNRVRKVDTSGNISTFAGSSVTLTSGVGDGGLAINANLNTPKGLAIDSSGNLYIADFGNYRVREVTTNGNITTVAGNGFNAQTFGSYGEGGQATAAPISPYNLALDGSNNIYIADSQDNIIRKVTVSTGIITTPAGNSYASYAGDGGSALMASLNTPQGIALDSAGNLFIADTGNLVIREVTTAGNIYTVAGMQGVQGSAGDGGLALNATLTAHWSLRTVCCTSQTRAPPDIRMDVSA
jgi:sugar lactone lactonase YvrE